MSGALESLDLNGMSAVMSPRQLVSVARSARNRIALWVGAVSGGKTFASLVAFLIALRRLNKASGIVVITGRTLQTIERNVIEPLQDRAKFGKFADQVVHTQGSNKAVILGQVVWLIGANNAADVSRITGATVKLAYVDEAILMPENFWQMLVSRLRVPGARLLATTNPGSKNHWLRTQFIKRPTETDLVMFHFTMLDNPSLEPSYVDWMTSTYRGMGGMFYDRYILGRWTLAEGAVYPNWNPDVGGGNIIEWDDMPEIRRVLGIALDYGTSNPTVALMLGITAERIEGRYDPAPRLILLDEWVDDPAISRRNHSPSEHAALFRSWLAETHLPSNRMVLDQSRSPFYIVDPAAKAFREELARSAQGAPGIATQPADNDVLAGIADVANLIGAVHPNGGKLLQSTTRCERWNSEITEYRWDAKATEDGDDKPLKENDHAMDAGRYDVRTTKPLWLQPMREAHRLAA